MDLYKDTAINHLANYIHFQQKDDDRTRPFQEYKEELVFNLIGNDSNRNKIAKAVLRLKPCDLFPDSEYYYQG